MARPDEAGLSPDGVVVPAEDAAIEPAVLEAELLTPAQEAELDRRRTSPTVVARQVVRVVRTGATHHRTRTAARHVGYTLVGLLIVVRTLWDASTHSRYERLLRAAEASGDHDKLLEWESRSETARERRHRRRMDWLNAPLRLVRAWAVGIAAGVGVLLALGIILAVADGDPHEAAVPLRAAVQVVRWAVWVVSIAWGPLLLAAPWIGVLALWQIGRTRSGPTRLVSRSGGTDGRAVVPDAGAILSALRHLGLAKLDQAFKAGYGSANWPLQIWVEDPHRDGKGWRAQLRLPQGVPVEHIARRDRKAILAHNLVRTPVEVWPTEPREQAGVLDLWVADPGSLSGPVPPWPLLADLDSATSDYFAGVPAGVNIRGDVVPARLFECNFVLGGQMGSGKSTLAITLLAGAMLDPLVDIDVFVMASNFDYDPMAPRLGKLMAEEGRGTIEACLETMTEALGSLAERGQALRDHEERAANRRIAELDPRLRPHVIVVDECQSLFMDDKYGELAQDTVFQLISKSRKYATTLVFLTPEPTKDSLPRKIVTVCSHKSCFSIGDQTGNDAVLGTGSYSAGISAVGLEPKTDEGLGDCGTAMTRGFTPKPSLLRSFYIPAPDLHRIMLRALALRADVAPAAIDAPTLDPLADVAAVLAGAPTLRTQEVLRRLGERNAAYREWTFGDLRKVLLAAGAPPRKTDGVMVVDAARVQQALSERDRREVVGDDES